MNTILNSYKTLVRFLGQVLSSEYEIVLHDLSDGNYTVIEIAHGFNSKRGIGAPLTKKALAFIEQGIYRKEDFVLNYYGAIGGARTISSTMFIKDDYDNLIGMLCVNHNITNSVQLLESLSKMLNVSQSMSIISSSGNQPDSPEVFTSDVNELVASLMEHMMPAGASAERLSQDERIEIIKELKKHGIFAIKGAVGAVAAQLNCSEPSVYRYLKNI